MYATISYEFKKLYIWETFSTIINGVKIPSDKKYFYCIDNNLHFQL